MKLSTRSAKDYSWDYRQEGQVEKAGQKLHKYLEENSINQET